MNVLDLVAGALLGFGPSQSERIDDVQWTPVFDPAAAR